MRNLLMVAAALTAVSGFGKTDAAPVTFDFSLLDSGGTQIGTGFYTFDDIAPGTQASFASLTGFSWGFEVPSLGISLSSAAGHLPSSDSLTQEGITLSGTPGSRTLTFFDNVATFVYHYTPPFSGSSGVQFNDTDLTQVDYVVGLSTVETGTFTAIERASAVPEPTSMALFGLTALGFGVGFRRRRNGETVEEEELA